MERARVTALQSEEREKKRKSQKRLDGRMVDGWTMDGQTYFFSYPIPIILSCLHLDTQYTHFQLILLPFSILFSLGGLDVCVGGVTHSLHFSSPVQSTITSPVFLFFLFPYLSLTDSDMYFYVLFFSLLPLSCFFFLLYSFSISFTLVICVCELSEVRVAVVVMVDLWSSFFLMCVFPFSFFFHLFFFRLIPIFPILSF